MIRIAPYFRTLWGVALATSLLGIASSVDCEPLRLAYDYYNEAERKVNNGRAEQAKKELAEALKIFPDDPNLLNLTGRLLLESARPARPEMLVDLFKPLCEGKSQRAEPYYWLAWAYVAQGDYERAGGMAVLARERLALSQPVLSPHTITPEAIKDLENALRDGRGNWWERILAYVVKNSGAIASITAMFLLGFGIYLWRSLPSSRKKLRRADSVGEEAAQAGGQENIRFDFFLCHNSRDKAAVRELAQWLSDSGVSYWLDEERLTAGQPRAEEIEKGLRASQSVAVLVGNDGIGPWQDEEQNAAIELAIHDKIKRPVIPVLLSGAPSEPELPMNLRIRTWVDLRAEADKAANFARLLRAIKERRPDATH